jgi:hypothetical protein
MFDRAISLMCTNLKLLLNAGMLDLVRLVWLSVVERIFPSA